MGYTLAEARDIVEDHLDDADNARWSTSQIDVGLKYALDHCLSEYVSAGGDRLHEIVSTTTASDGTVDLSSYDPKEIKSVSLVIGSRYFPLKEVSYQERGLNDAAARSVEIRLLRTLALPTTTTHPLVGNGATAGKSFNSFESWICARAARFCAVKDAEARQELIALEQEMRDAVMVQPSIPKASAFPERPSWYSNWFVWAFKPDTQKIQIGRRGW